MPRILLTESKVEINGSCHEILTLLSACMRKLKEDKIIDDEDIDQVCKISKANTKELNKLEEEINNDKDN